MHIRVYACLCMLSGIQRDQSPKSKSQGKYINLYCWVYLWFTIVNSVLGSSQYIFGHSNKKLWLKHWAHLLAHVSVEVEQCSGLVPVIQPWCEGPGYLPCEYGCVSGLLGVWFCFSVDSLLFPKGFVSDQVLKIPEILFKAFFCPCLSFSLSMFHAVITFS